MNYCEDKIIKTKANKDYEVIGDLNLIIRKGDTIVSYGVLSNKSSLFFSINHDSFFIVSEMDLHSFISCLDVICDEQSEIVKTEILSQYIRNNYRIKDYGIYKKPISRSSANAFGFVIKSEEHTFGEMIGKLLDEKGWTCEELANKAFTTKQTISNIVSDKVKNPKREMIYAILLAFHLSYNEFVKYMEYAGITFNRSKTFDLVIKKCVEDGVYDMQRINMYLEENGIEPYGYKFYNKE